MLSAGGNRQAGGGGAVNNVFAFAAIFSFMPLATATISPLRRPLLH